MRALRAVLVIVGLGLVGYGLVRLTGLPSAQVLAVGIWAAGGVVVHDGLLAPLVVLAGLAAALRSPARWRTPLLWLVVVLGPLTLVAVPVLGRFGARPDNPTLLDRPYVLGYLGLVAVAVAIAVVAVRRTPPDSS